MKLAIIGTAGRKDDAKLLTEAHYRMMLVVSQVVAETLGAKHLVSGGAAWADHVAVRLYLDGAVDGLTLHLPAPFHSEQRPQFAETTSQYDAGRTSNYYHERFSGVRSLSEIAAAIDKGAIVHTKPGGFKARNSDVANEADALLAFTFGDGARVKDGGTADTVAKFLSRRIALEKASTLHNLRTFHFNLTDRRLYTL